MRASAGVGCGCGVASATAFEAAGVGAGCVEGEGVALGLFVAEKRLDEPFVAEGSEVEAAGDGAATAVSVKVGAVSSAASEARADGLGRSSSSGPSGPILLRPALSSRFASLPPPFGRRCAAASVVGRAAAALAA